LTGVKRCAFTGLIADPVGLKKEGVRPFWQQPRFWGICAGAAIGVALGGGLYTFVYAQGHSYFSNDPRACANCHIMQDHFDAWLKSSHRAVATCNDCHTPAGFVPKYLAKAENGFFHSWHFTTGDFPDPLRIKPRNQAVTERACRGCHEPIVRAIEAHPGAGQLACVRCHGEVGHPLR
jgi:cytochrome c nitrite reductase small subunit